MVGKRSKSKSIKDIKNGDAFAYRNVGYGLVSYEKGDSIAGRKKGKLYTDTFDKYGMEWNESRKTWVFDGGMGMRTELCWLSDVPPGGFE